MSWTDDRIETLKRLWADGLSASQIAAALGGGVSRNAVIGKIHRLGLSGRVKAPPRAQAPRRAAAARPLPQPRAMAVAAAVVRVVERPLPVMLPELLPAGEVVPFARGVSLVDLGAHECRWPVGDPSSEDFSFCGGRTAAGETYCCGHADLAFPSRLKKRKG